MTEQFLFTETKKTLFVYEMSNLIDPLDKIALDCHIFSSLISNSILYLGGEGLLYIFKVDTSLKKPLRFVKKIETKATIYKIKRERQEILLGQYKGNFQVFDIDRQEITRSKLYKEVGSIYDILAMDDGAHFLLAAFAGISKITAGGDFVKRFYRGQSSSCICHISGSKYLVGFEDHQLKVWDAEKD